MDSGRQKLKEELVRQVIEKLAAMDIRIQEEPLNSVPVSVSGRHVHLTRADMDLLFGPGSQLSVQKELSQPGQFAANEKVTVAGPRGSIENVRILGPLRKSTQIELAASDARRIGVRPVVRPSGVLEGTPGATIIGPAGTVETEQGCIAAERHIHMTPGQAIERGLTDGQEVKVRIDSRRGGVLEHVHVRVSPDYAYDMHIDTDEANAVEAMPGMRGNIIL